MSTLLARDLCKRSQVLPPRAQGNTRRQREPNRVWICVTTSDGSFPGFPQLFSVCTPPSIPTGTRQTSSCLCQTNTNTLLNHSLTPLMPPTPTPTGLPYHLPAPPCSAPHRTQTLTPHPSLCVFFHQLLSPGAIINTALGKTTGSSFPLRLAETAQ